MKKKVQSKGRDSKFFMELGFEVESIDGSPAICKGVSKYFEKEVICNRFEDIIYEDEFMGSRIPVHKLYKNYFKVLTNSLIPYIVNSVSKTIICEKVVKWITMV